MREARRRLAELMDQVEAGGEVVLLRHGRPVARLVPPRPEERRLPPLADFRASLGAGTGAAPVAEPEAKPDTKAEADIVAGDNEPRREPP